MERGGARRSSRCGQATMRADRTTKSLGRGSGRGSGRSPGRGSGRGRTPTVRPHRTVACRRCTGSTSRRSAASRTPTSRSSAWRARRARAQTQAAATGRRRPASCPQPHLGISSGQCGGGWGGAIGVAGVGWGYVGVAGSQFAVLVVGLGAGRVTRRGGGVRRALARSTHCGRICR